MTEGREPTVATASQWKLSSRTSIYVPVCLSPMNREVLTDDKTMAQPSQPPAQFIHIAKTFNIHRGSR